MKQAKAKKNGAAGCALALIVFFVGIVVFFVIPVIGWIGGPILCVVSFFIVFHSEKVWRCAECRAIVPRG